MLTRREALGLLAGAPAALAGRAAQKIALVIQERTIRLEVGEVSYCFSRVRGTWGFDAAWVRDKVTATPLSRADGFCLGGGESPEFTVLADSPQKKHIRFSLLKGHISYRVVNADPLPRIAIEFAGLRSPVCAWRTPSASPEQHGAWATRGETASDAEGREVFLDASGRLVFGHSRSGVLDAVYVIQAELLDNIHRHGKTMQPSETFFKSARVRADGGYFGQWQIKLGPRQPKRFAIVFDRDLGGRLHDVCERYYAAAVDTQVDLAAVPNSYDPYRALQRMPLRLSCPESLIPGYGWHMEEYFPGYAKASYPFGEDSGIQTAALLAYEGHATRRDWEKYFGQYVISQMPLWGAADGKGFFTVRPGGWTRWAYNTDYVTLFPLMEGGNWTDSEHLYRIASMFDDRDLRQRALDLMRHDVDVKMDLEKMTFPPCWNPLTGQLQDHRDDWETTAGLAYCAEIASEILHPETGEERYLKVADRITDWFASIWWPETRMNWLHPKVNTFHCFMGPIVRAFVHRYERGRDRRFLDIARDLTWVMILTLCVTPHKDSAGRSMTGVTCVGVRDCVDYDCAPNLCHEKDLAFLEIMGVLMAHVSGPGYAKFLAMQKLVLPRDSWKDAFGVQEQRDLNLRTNYDNYARGMANLAFALNRGTDPLVAIYDRLAVRRDLAITKCRDIILANGTMMDRKTLLRVSYLEPGRYSVTLDGHALAPRTAAALEEGIAVAVAANSMRRVKVTTIAIDPTPVASRQYDSSVTWLSDLREMAAQRGIGLLAPVFIKDRTFRGNPITLSGRHCEKGLGLAANTVIIYDLAGRYLTFAATLGVDPDSPAEGPKRSVFLTVHVDGRCKFTSGGMLQDTPPKDIEVDVRNARVLVIRMSGNWDDGGNLTNDMASLGDARLIGRSV